MLQIHPAILVRMRFVDARRKIICPDNIVRTFFQRGDNPCWGYVIALKDGKRTSVVGLSLNGKFTPHPLGANAHLVGYQKADESVQD